MNFRDYYLSLEPEEREAYADRAGTTPAYIYCHLIRTPPTRVPTIKKIKRLADATSGDITFEALVEYFASAAQAS